MSLKTLFRRTEAPTRRAYSGKVTVWLTQPEENLAIVVAAHVIMDMSTRNPVKPTVTHETHELHGFSCTLATHPGPCWNTCEVTDTYVIESDNRSLIYRIAQLIEMDSVDLQTTTRDAVQEDPFRCTITRR